jgi:hypothetical protein
MDTPTKGPEMRVAEQLAMLTHYTRQDWEKHCFYKLFLRKGKNPTKVY